MCCRPVNPGATKEPGRTIIQTCPVGPLGGQRPLAALFSALNTEKRPPGCCTAASGGRPLGILPTPTPPTSSWGHTGFDDTTNVDRNFVGERKLEKSTLTPNDPLRPAEFHGTPNHHWLSLVTREKTNLFGPPRVSFWSASGTRGGSMYPKSLS